MAKTFDVTRQFFDRAAVIDAVGRAGATVLKKQGALVRKIAQRSMPYRKKPAAPGSPPSAHKPNAFLRKFLFFSFDPASKSVVIGPEKFGRGTSAAKIQEFGGEAKVANPRRTLRVLNGGGEMRYGDKPTRKSKVAKDTILGAVVVHYAKLLTPEMVRHANKINALLYGPDIITAHNEPRPFMGPALKKAQTTLPKLWADSVKG